MENNTPIAAVSKPLSPVIIFSSIILLMGIVIAISMYTLSSQSLRLDESQSLWQTTHSLSQMLYVVAQDVHVPLYHLILRSWQLVFGNDVTVNRYLSLIFYVLSIPLFYIFGALMYSRRVALFATLIYSLSPMMNWYGNEIRMYSLLTLVTLINQYFFVKLFRDSTTPKKSAWVGYTISALFGIYTHYFFFLTLATQAIFYCVHRKLFHPSAIWRGVLSGTIILAAIAPWIIYVYELGKISNSEPLLPKPSTIDIFNTFSQFMFGFQTDPINTVLVSLWPISVLLIFLSLRKSTRVSTDTIYMVYSLILPNVLLFVASFIISPVYLSRYLIFTAPYLYLLLSWLFSTYTPRVESTAKVLFVGLVVLTLVIELASTQTPTKEDYADATEYLNTHATTRDVIAVSAPFTIYPVEYYYHGAAELATLPIWDRSKLGPIPPFNAGTFPGEIDTLKAGHQNFWLLQSYDQGYQEKMRIYFDTHFQRLQSVVFSQGLTLYEYKLRYD